MSLLATTIGERIDMRAGKLLLFPLLAVGVGSVIYWRIFDDLRPYVMVQFYPMVALPLMLLLFPPKYSGTGGIVSMICLYGPGEDLRDRSITRSLRSCRQVVILEACRGAACDDLLCNHCCAPPLPPLR